MRFSIGIRPESVDSDKGAEGSGLFAFIYTKVGTYLMQTIFHNSDTTPYEIVP
ncbi:MAG: hypothetical protein K2K81_02060 [Muribaculaceae bacterium]|nr:hypothetical protein [Muribaculaceae bacterium]